MSAVLEHAAVACNRVSHAVDWSSDGLAAFAAGRFVCLYRPLASDQRGVVCTLRGHTDRVNCVAFVRTHTADGLGNDSSVLVSASADKSLIVWRKGLDGQWRLSCRIDAHEQGIVALAVVQGRDVANDDGDWIATAASDSTVRLWRLTNSPDGGDKLELFQAISAGRHHMMALGLAFLPKSQVPVLLAGGTDMRLHVYVKQPESDFKLRASLQGHTDWIRSIQVATYTNTHDGETHHDRRFRDGDLMVATASQDRHIRIWKITADQAVRHDGADAKVDDMAMALQDLDIGNVGDWTQLSTKAHLIPVETSPGSTATYAFMFDALLLGHDDWVHSVRWQPASPKASASSAAAAAARLHQPMALVSASADKSIMLWEPDAHSEAWVYTARLGEVGGSTLGFYGALLSAHGDAILSNGYNGAMHVWCRAADKVSADWSPAVGTSGHFSSVEGLAWDTSGTFLLTASADQTARMFAPWQRNGCRTWHEIARAQIHGYDLNCLAFVHKYQYVSGADEKVIRVFEAPRTFAQTLVNLTGVAESEDVLSKRPVGANVPALGLSNKAVFEGDLRDVDASHDYRNLSAFTAVAATSTSLTTALVQPPFEEHLLQHTLWPETNKLYGHGYEIVTLAANKSGTLVASACKAAKAEHAAIRLWSTATWKEVSAPLAFHTLTVTTIKFSPDGRLLLTAGRDRGWALFNVEKALNDGTWALEASQPKAHARIVWASSWSADGACFATASRDKLVKIWSKTGGEWSCVHMLKCNEAVTMIDFCPRMIAGAYVVATGLETGEIILHSVRQDGSGAWSSSLASVQIAASDLHVLAVKGLAWRPNFEPNGEICLASCSEDHSVRVFSLKLE
ncbi:Elongator subunit elp2 [Polyrhizophydium stewartii]|uniref:Elongator complex protein 2 n=1 Tax=Polyrhizophydium stewartii TaxID=2732419 RepID=A0ABR4N7H4_9FUNG